MNREYYLDEEIEEEDDLQIRFQPRQAIAIDPRKNLRRIPSDEIYTNDFEDDIEENKDEKDIQCNVSTVQPSTQSKSQLQPIRLNGPINPSVRPKTASSLETMTNSMPLTSKLQPIIQTRPSTANPLMKNATTCSLRTTNEMISTQTANTSPQRYPKLQKISPNLSSRNLRVGKLNPISNPFPNEPESPESSIVEDVYDSDDINSQSNKSESIGYDDDFEDNPDNYGKMVAQSEELSIPEQRDLSGLQNRPSPVKTPHHVNIDTEKPFTEVTVETKCSKKEDVAHEADSAMDSVYSQDYETLNETENIIPSYDVDGLELVPLEDNGKSHKCRPESIQQHVPAADDNSFVGEVKPTPTTETVTIQDAFECGVMLMPKEVDSSYDKQINLSPDAPAVVDAINQIFERVPEGCETGPIEKHEEEASISANINEYEVQGKLSHRPTQLLATTQAHDHNNDHGVDLRRQRRSRSKAGNSLDIHMRRRSTLPTQLLFKELIKPIKRQDRVSKQTIDGIEEFYETILDQYDHMNARLSMFNELIVSADNDWKISLQNSLNRAIQAVQVYQQKEVRSESLAY